MSEAVGVIMLMVAFYLAGYAIWEAMGKEGLWVSGLVIFGTAWIVVAVYLITGGQ